MFKYVFCSGYVTRTYTLYKTALRLAIFKGTFFGKSSLNSKDFYKAGIKARMLTIELFFSSIKQTRAQRSASPSFKF